MFWREIKLFPCSVFHIFLSAMKIETGNINKLIDTFVALIVMIQPIHKQSYDESYLQKLEIFFKSWGYFTVLGFVFNLSSALWTFMLLISRLSSAVRRSRNLVFPFFFFLKWQSTYAQEETYNNSKNWHFYNFLCILLLVM